MAESDEALPMKISQAASRQQQYRFVHIFNHVFTVVLYEAASLETVARDFNTGVTALPFFLFAEKYEDRRAR